MTNIKTKEIINIYFHEGHIPTANFSVTTFKDNLAFENVNLFQSWLNTNIAKEESFLQQRLCFFIHIKGNEFSSHVKKNPKADPKMLTETLRNELFDLYPLIKDNFYYVTSDSVPEYKDTYQIINVCSYGKVIEVVKNESLKSIKVKGLITPIVHSIPKRRSLENHESKDHSPFYFVSHASKDKDIINLFHQEILVLGLNITSKNIFYTSSYLSSIKNGDDIPNELKNALKRMKIFIQFVSSNYKKSEICLLEMGGAWSRLPQKQIISLLIPPTPFNKIGYIKYNKLNTKLDDANALTKVLVDDLKEFFCNEQFSIANFKVHLETFTTGLKKMLKTSAKKS